MVHLQSLHEQPHVFTVIGFFQKACVFFHRDPLMDIEGGVTPVVDEKVRSTAIGPDQGLFSAPPVFLEGFAFPGEHGGRTFFGDGGRGMILGAENIARRPTDVRSQNLQGVDQHGGLNGHVQAAHDLHAFEGLGLAIFFAHGHQAGHLSFR